ncbi:MAG: peptide chain release factor 2 [Deltaproteobacteria bacterium]|nr:peptide chain release factor 2 [Deltaproteobacteria bacterium]
MSKELIERLEKNKKLLTELDQQLDITAKRKEAESLRQESENTNFWNDQKEAQKKMQQLDVLKSLIDKRDAHKKSIDDVEAILELLKEEESEEFISEAEEKLASIEKGIEALRLQRMLSGEHDQASSILMINAGAGGTEACDWVDMLARMYRRWCDQKGFRNDVVDFTAGDGAGFRSVTITVEGDFSYGYLKAENGVHRLVRISPFDANKRRHTSFASVLVLPDIEQEIEVEIKEEDLRVDTFRSGGAGGQHVNKTESAIRLTHIPTGIVVACRNERSQHKNRATAMKLLKAKIYETELKKQLEQRKKLEGTKKKIEWGSQIRSYVMQPYQMVKDHRTNFETGNVTAVMDGDIDPFIEKFLLEFQD